MAFERLQRSTVDVVGDVVNQAALLLRKEGQLARAEVSEKLGDASVGLALILGGAILLIPALTILLSAAATALINAGMSVGAAALIVGGLAFIAGIILVAIGASRLRAEELKPQRTIRQLQSAASLAKQQVRTDSDLQRAP